MTAAFATLNPDLLHLCLSHVTYGRDAARAGATCKHWRAVASTERLWRDLCMKWWPSTAKLPRAPASYLEFFKRRDAVRPYSAPTIQLSSVSLILDGLFGVDPHSGVDLRFSEVLSFADATPCLFQPYGMSELGICSGFEWPVPGLIEVLTGDITDLDIGVDILRDDGKIATVGRFEAVDVDFDDDHNPMYYWKSEALDLEPQAEFVTRIRDGPWFYLHAELSFVDGKLKVFASNRQTVEDQMYVELHHVLALLEWA